MGGKIEENLINFLCSLTQHNHILANHPVLEKMFIELKSNLTFKKIEVDVIQTQIHLQIFRAKNRSIENENVKSN